MTTLTTTTDDLRLFAQDPPHGAAEASSEEISRLYAALELVDEQTHPRTAHLLTSVKRMARKVMEEAAEVAIEAVRRRRPAASGKARISSSIWSSCGASAVSSRVRFGPK
jgi:hypothetical protein